MASYLILQIISLQIVFSYSNVRWNKNTGMADEKAIRTNMSTRGRPLFEMMSCYIQL